MGGLFSSDSLFGKAGAVLADVMILGLLWLIFSIPVITIGAATSAVFYVTTKKVSKKEGYLWRDFWKSFKESFLKATVTWVILLIVFGLLLWNIWNIGFVDVFGNVLLIVYYILLIQVAFVTVYVFPLIARFDMKIVQIFRTAAFMANRHFLTTVLSIGFGIVILFISWEMPALSVFAMGAYCYATSFLFMKIFKKYRPDLDPEDEAIGLNPLNLGEDSGRSKASSQPVLNMDTIKNAGSQEVVSEESEEEAEK